jgi:stress response protein SCP2
MTVNLQKGEKIDLRKTNGESLRNIVVGLGWDALPPPKKGGIMGLFSSQPKTPEIDCDASVLMCQNGKLAGNKDVIYFGNLFHTSGAVKHTGDNRTGDGEGDDEQIIVNLDKLPAEYEKLVFVANVYQANLRGQHFGMIQNAFIRIVDMDTNNEICRFDLTEKYDGKKSMIFGEVVKQNDAWQFNALGEGTTDDSLGALMKRFN